MTLREYAKQINGLLRENPEAKEMQVFYSVDDEGNSYDLVKFNPVILTNNVHIDFKERENKGLDMFVCIN